MSKRVRAGWFTTVLAVAGLALVPSHAGASQPPPSYVALGDSYAAGPLIPAYEQPYGCLKSSNNYAHLLAPRVGLPLRDVTCSGARTAHMTSPQGVSPGPNPPQFDALDVGTALVTVQIGGNDIGFSSIARDCMSPTPVGTPCQDRYVVNGVDELRNRIDAVAPRIKDTFLGIKQRAPRARVIALGYPAIFPEDLGLTCWPQMPVALDDIPYLRGVHKALNAMIEEQADIAGVTYVDVYGPSIGHDSCQPPPLRWVEPLVPASPAAPIHPNLVGMIGVADVLAAELDLSPLVPVP